MSLTTIVALLQSALLLLTLAQSGTNLPQSFRDNATSVAQQAISEATLALSSPSSQSPQDTAPQSGQPAVIPNNTSTNSSSSMETAPICTQNPQLSVVPHDNGSGMATFDATYSTGCPLDLNTPVSYSVSVASTTVYTMQGSIGNPNSDVSADSDTHVGNAIFYWEPLPQSWNSWGAAEDLGLPANTPITFDISVGSSTQQVVAQ